jgi:predicted transcriptional regulator
MFGIIFCRHGSRELEVQVNSEILEQDNMLRANEMGGRVTWLKKTISSAISAIWKVSYLQNPILDGHTPVSPLIFL